MLALLEKVFPRVGKIMRVVREAREALAAGQAFAEEVERTLEGINPLKEKATGMIKEFQDVEKAIDDALGRRPALD